MALPQLNSTPSYRITIPSIGKKTTFRPFLVKEQKALLIAYETQDKTDIVRAITRTIHACVEEPIEETLTTFDIDYLYQKLYLSSQIVEVLLYVLSWSWVNKKSKSLSKHP